jgi:hypothetical protein
VQSLVSGEKIPTLGYYRRGEGTNGDVSILIETRSREGESGTGFLDQHGGLWVLHASPEPQEVEEMRREYEKLTGKTFKAVTSISGPFGGKHTE